MNHLSARVYVRLRAICCSVWGCSPAEYEVWAEAEMIAAEDVIETVWLKGSEPFGVNVISYIYREREFKKRRKLEEAKRLVMQLRAETDPARRATIEKRLEEVNK